MCKLWVKAVFRLPRNPYKVFIISSNLLTCKLETSPFNSDFKSFLKPPSMRMKTWKLKQMKGFSDFKKPNYEKHQVLISGGAFIINTCLFGNWLHHRPASPNCERPWWFWQIPPFVMCLTNCMDGSKGQFSVLVLSGFYVSPLHECQVIVVAMALCSFPWVAHTVEMSSHNEAAGPLGELKSCKGRTETSLNKSHLKPIERTEKSRELGVASRALWPWKPKWHVLLSPKGWG